MSETLEARLARFAPDRIVLLWGTLLVLVELLAVLLYLRLAPVTPISYRQYAYPFIWINVGLWAVLTTTAPRTDQRRRRIGAAVAVGYFLVLAWVGGVIRPGYLFVGSEPASQLRVALWTIPPGWGPAVLYDAGVVQLALLPYKVVGYLALAYLVYVTVLDAAGSALGGLLGLLSCVSCTWPVLATVLTGVVGSASGIAGLVYGQSYGISTAVFVVTVALLSWRPSLR